jgi:hypothetical protein
MLRPVRQWYIESIETAPDNIHGFCLLSTSPFSPNTSQYLVPLNSNTYLELGAVLRPPRRAVDLALREVFMSSDLVIKLDATPICARLRSSPETKIPPTLLGLARRLLCPRSSVFDVIVTVGNQRVDLGPETWALEHPARPLGRRRPLGIWTFMS